MPPDFYNQDTVSLTQELLGQILVHESEEGIASGRIVETEAYLSKNDLASHSAKGQTKRNAIMFGPPGHAYVYFTYGLHWLFNVVSGPNGKGEAVLIRALEPVEGIKLMQERRRTHDLKLLCRGPARLVQALGITTNQNGADLRQGTLRLQPGSPIPTTQIATAPRIGIIRSAELPLRFYLKGNPFISTKA